MDDEDSPPNASTRSKSGRTRTRKGKAQDPSQTGSDSPFEELRNRKVTVQMDGIERKLTLAEALLQKTLEQALADGRMAIREILKRIQAQEAAKAPTARLSFKFLVKHNKPQGVDEAMLVLGIATNVSGISRSDEMRQLTLEPWAVRRGLTRTKGLRLTNKQIHHLKAQTRDPESINWPRGSEQ